MQNHIRGRGFESFQVHSHDDVSSLYEVQILTPFIGKSEAVPHKYLWVVMALGKHSSIVLQRMRRSSPTIDRSI